MSELFFTIIGICIGSVLFALLGYLIGGFVEGCDRRISARMQGRVGPKIRQPFWDISKLFKKEKASTNPSENTYITCALVLLVISGGVFFAGSNLLLSIILSTLSTLFFIMAAYSSRSPFSTAGGAREILQVLSYEPMEYFMAIIFYIVIGSFNVITVSLQPQPLIVYGWPVFIGMLFIQLVKLRKSPFDLSTSHAAHQELLQGTLTEMSGPALAKAKLMHWYETVLMLGWTAMFFLDARPESWIVAVVAAIVAWFLDIWIDNNFARVKWQSMISWCWGITLCTSIVNFIFVSLL